MEEAVEELGTFVEKPDPRRQVLAGPLHAGDALQHQHDRTERVGARGGPANGPAEGQPGGAEKEEGRQQQARHLGPAGAPHQAVNAREVLTVTSAQPAEEPVEPHLLRVFGLEGDAGQIVHGARLAAAAKHRAPAGLAQRDHGPGIRKGRREQQ